jgi:hypothetical protein
MLSDVLQLSPRITCLPVIHGSGDFALAVRRLMLEQAFDCVAVPEKTRGATQRTTSAVADERLQNRFIRVLLTSESFFRRDEICQDRLARTPSIFF